jgi:hypothetical protein
VSDKPRQEYDAGPPGVQPLPPAEQPESNPDDVGDDFSERMMYDELPLTEAMIDSRTIRIGQWRYQFPPECRHWRNPTVRVSSWQEPELFESGSGRGGITLVEFDELGPRRYTEQPAGPLELVVMVMARELHDREHPDCDWFGHVGSTVTSFCRRAVEARGLNWPWVMRAIALERLAIGEPDGKRPEGFDPR